MDQHFPEKIEFINEVDIIMEVQVKYEWKLITCSSCNGMGHTEEVCRTPEVKKRQVWHAKG